MKEFKAKTFNVPDFYNAYAARLLAENPDYYSTSKQGNPIPHYYIWKHGKLGPIEVINYMTFSNVVREYYKLAVEKVLEGKKFKLGPDLGYIQVFRYKRDPRNLVPDWHSSLKYKEELISKNEPLTEIRPMRNRDGELIRDKEGNILKKEYKRWLIYYTDEEYPYIKWVKERFAKGKYSKSDKVPYLRIYKFKPTTCKGKKNGFIEKLYKVYRSSRNIRVNYKTYEHNVA